MLRILEPEVMDTEADAEEYDAMDFLAPNLKFALDALTLVADLAEPRILDVGTGTAQIPLLMLERRPDIEVTAVDLADEMLKVAHRHAAVAGVADRLKLGKMDGKALRLPKERFDLVMSNSTIHHIPDPVVAFREIRRVVKPRGAVIVRDLFRPPSMDAAWAIVKAAAAGESLRQQQLFFDSLCAALTLEEVTTVAAQAGLEGLTIRMVSDRHWTAERAATAVTAST